MKYLEGDVVRGVNGDTMVQGVVFFEYGRTELKDVGWSVEALETQGFTVEMVRAVPRPLPTEDGLYMIQNSDGHVVVYALKDGVWKLTGSGSIMSTDKMQDRMAEFGLTRLVAAE